MAPMTEQVDMQALMAAQDAQAARESREDDAWQAAMAAAIERARRIEQQARAF